MGSLFSTPSVSSISPVQYVAPSPSVNASQVSGVTGTEESIQTNTDDDAVKDIIRNISRGRSSTIQTSFRGVLGEANSLAPQRKTLLGE